MKVHANDDHKFILDFYDFSILTLKKYFAHSSIWFYIRQQKLKGKTTTKRRLKGNYHNRTNFSISRLICTKFRICYSSIKSLRVTQPIVPTDNIRCLHVLKVEKESREEQHRETVRKIHSVAFVGPKLNERRYDASDFLAAGANRFPVCGEVARIK